MHISLYGPTHLQTLFELQEIAKRHNCYINVFFTSNVSDDVNEGLEKLVNEKVMTEEVARSLYDYCFLNEYLYTHDEICFELIEKVDNENKYHQMIFSYDDMKFCIGDKNIYGLIEDDKVLQETETWIEEHTEDDFDYFNYNDMSTKVNGFDGCDKDIYVYREGMAVKFFGDLVCDYLHEPRIIRTY